MCTPGTTEACYDGPAGTQDLGLCVAGTRTCDASGAAWGSCMDQVLPVREVCGDNADNDCDGTADNPIDDDGDGWTDCDGDCDETRALVNLGAFEIVGDGLDNDCSATTSDTTPAALCSASTKFAGVTASDQVKALDLCQTTTANPPLAQRTWGLISTTHQLANGTTPSAADASNIANLQASVTTLFGSTIVPRRGVTLAGLSTGASRDANDAGFVSPVSGTAFTSALPFPSSGPLGTYLAAHGGNVLAGSCGAATCPIGTGANDSVMLNLTIRVPTNAYGVSFDFRFLSSEYQNYQCTQFNDQFLILLTTGAAGIPADRNIAFDATGAPISVNSKFLSVCGGNTKNCGTCADGTAGLAGTGYDAVNGAATPWLTTDAPVIPGETITLRFMLFDLGDHIFDSQVLLDNLRWSATPMTVGTHP
ncbi:MAG: choice-of-anchor L domain-containing protein [Deltaproteobacteria bacterium]|nr:choice-of-anchor L domain-containing protein [Deltaproteobacteria bacterium]